MIAYLGAALDSEVREGEKAQLVAELSDKSQCESCEQVCGGAQAAARLLGGEAAGWSQTRAYPDVLTSCGNGGGVGSF